MLGSSQSRRYRGHPACQEVHNLHQAGVRKIGLPQLKARFSPQRVPKARAKRYRVRGRLLSLSWLQTYQTELKSDSELNTVITRVMDVGWR